MKKTIFVAIILVTFLLSMPIVLFAQEFTRRDEGPVTEKCLNTMPCYYLGKYIVTEGLYIDSSTSILDDWFHNKCTRFNSKDFVNFRTNDIFQYFIKNDKAKILCSLKGGDKITISGWVMSCEEKRPWIEVDSVVKAPSE